MRVLPLGFRSLLHLLCFVCFAGVAFSQYPVDGKVEVLSLAPASQFDPSTGEVLSSTTLQFTNTGASPLVPPFLVDVVLSGPGDLSLVRVDNAEKVSGLGEPQRWRLPSPLLPNNALGPGESFTAELVLRRPSGVLVSFATSLWAIDAFAPELSPIGGEVEITAETPVSEFDPATGVIVSRTSLQIRNQGSAVWQDDFFLDVSLGGLGDLGLASIDGAVRITQPGEPPLWRFALAPQVSGGVGPGQAISLELVIRRPSSVQVFYTAEAKRFAQGDPLAVFTLPGQIRAGDSILLDARESTDPMGGALSYRWFFPGGELEGIEQTLVLEQPGSYGITLEVTGSGGRRGVLSRQILVVPAGTFALGRVRVLDESGQPLSGASIRQTGPDGQERTIVADDEGFAVVGGDPGLHTWEFTAPGHYPAWRKSDLPEGSVEWIPSPWLALRRSPAAQVSPLAEAVFSAAGDVYLFGFAAGAFGDAAPLRVADLGPQSLPFPLPPGWNPLAAFVLETGAPILEPGVVSLSSQVGTLPGTWVRLDETELVWKVVSVGQTPQSMLTVENAGVHAFVVADTGLTEPPEPVVGEQLAGTSLRVPSAGLVTALGRVTPGSALASTQAGEVTALAEVVFSSPEPIPGGSFFRTLVREEYLLNDGRRLRTPVYDTTITAYGPDGSVAYFPLRPRLLLGGDQLEEALIEVEVYDLEGYVAGVVDTSGGFFQFGGLTLGLPPREGVDRSIVEVRPVAVSSLADAFPGIQATFAFELLGPTVTDAEYSFSLEGLIPNRDYLLVRIVEGAGRTGLEPRLRMRADGAGRLESIEPSAGPRLPGLTGSGRYLVVLLDGPLALVEGTVVAANGSPKSDLLAWVEGTAWLARTRAGGTFSLVALSGESVVRALDPSDDNEGTATIEVAPSLPATQVEVFIVVTRPTVLSVFPEDGSERVPVVTPIEVIFSKPMDPLSLGVAGVVLREPNGDLVTASLSLDRSSRKATLLPVNPLFAGTVHTLELDPGLTDTRGLLIDGPLSFSFRTRAAPVRSEGARLTIYEPDAESIPGEVLSRLVGYDPAQELSMVVAVGTAGTADAEVPVILVNETTGETATVLSRPDGSFANFIRADVEDFISAVFVNSNGTRVSVPATEQRFDDGRIGLYRYGGILEAESDGGPVQVLIEPEAIETRAIFKVQNVNLNQLANIIQGSEPTDGTILGAVTVSYEIEEDLSSPAALSFTIDVDSLVLPEGITDPAAASFVLTSVLETEDGYVYDIIDSMKLVGDQLVTASPPFPGALFRKLVGNLQKTSAWRTAVPNTAFSALGLPTLQQTAIHVLLLPMMMAQGTTSNIVGTVYAVREGENVTPENFRSRVPGAVVSFQQPPFPTGGRLRPGTFVATADEKGNFAFRVDVTLESFAYQLSATHPRFPNQRAFRAGSIGGLSERLLSFSGLVEFGTFNIQRNDIYFVIPPPSSGDVVDDTPPVVRASHAPNLPAAGPDGAILVVGAVDNEAMAYLEVVLRSANDSAGNPLDVNEVATLELLEETRSRTRMEQRYRVRANRSARVVLGIRAMDEAGNPDPFREQTHVIDFGRQPMLSAPDQPDTSDPVRVLFSWPVENSQGLAAFPEILLRFSKALPEEAFLPGATDWILFGGGEHRILTVTPSPDYREVRVRFEGTPRGPVQLVVGSPLTDRTGRPFNQDPGSETEVPFVLNFSLADSQPAVLDLTRGGGVRGGGSFAFSLDRLDFRSSHLVSWDLRDPANPVRAATLNLPANATDLAYIPGYPMPAGPNQPCVTRNLVIAIGGNTAGGGVDQVIVSPKWMWVIDVTNPSNPFRLSSGLISVDNLALVPKVKVIPPLVAYLETSADSTAVYAIDLVAFVIGHNATPGERDQFPDEYVPGVDLDGDGSFCGPGDSLPQPDRQPVRHFGALYSFAPLNPAERIIDFDIDGQVGTFFTVSYNRGARETTLRNLLISGDPLDDELGSLVIPGGYEPKRMLFLPAQPILVEGDLRVLDLVLITLYGKATEGALAIVDVSEPAQPVLLELVDLPAGLGIPNSMEVREDGLLVMAVGSQLLLLDPRSLLEFGTDGSWLALRGVVPDFGSGVRSYVSDASGIQVISAGGRNLATFTGPDFSLLTLPGAPMSVPALLALGETGLRQKLSGANLVERARTMGKTLSRDNNNSIVVESDPLEGDHYYILLRAPGGMSTDQSIDLLVAGLNGAGGMSEPSALSRLPAVLLDPQTRSTYPEAGGMVEGFAFEGSIRAHRLSSDPANPLYNRFLAGPLVLHSKLSAGEGQALQGQLPRYHLRADRYLMVALSPGGEAGASALQPFRSTLTSDGILPGAGLVIPVEFARRPLLFVPGVMASRLVDADAWGFGSGLLTDLWVDPLKALPDLFGTLDKLVLTPQGESRENIRAVDALRYLLAFNVQGDFLKFLREELGYREYLRAPRDHDQLALFQKYNADPGRFSREENPDYDKLAQQPDLFVFPYDWRLDNKRNAQKLAAYVDLILEAHPDVDGVDIVAHSMGGLVSRRFQLDHPDKVHRLITIASPFLGAPKAIFTMYSGDMDDKDLNFVTPLEASRRIARYMPALHQLMPNQGYFQVGGRPLLESTWDLNQSGILSGPYEYGEYRDALNQNLFASGEEPFPQPIANNESFHLDPALASNNNTFDWSGDTSSTQFYHIVALQQTPRTIDRIVLETTLRADREFRDIGLTLPALTFSDSSRPGQSSRVRLPQGELALNPFESQAFRLGTRMRPLRGAGDGTVPLLSAVRAFGQEGSSLNTPGAVMIPVISRSVSRKETEAASHVGVLNNPDLFQLIARILKEDFSTSQQPRLTVTTNAPVNEGSPLTFSVAIDNRPANASEPPIIVWDTGDGRVITGAENEELQHVYTRNGSYTLICSVYYPGLTGAVMSRTIQVDNVPPVVSLRSIPESPRPGERFRIVADIDDPGVEDQFYFEWIRDGEALSAVPPTAFFLEQVFLEEGTYSYTVRVDDGTSLPVDASLDVTVSTSSFQPNFFQPQQVQEPGFSVQNTGSSFGNVLTVDRIDLLLTGHFVEAAGSLDVRHDGRQLVSFLSPSSVTGTYNAMAREVLGDRQESIRIFRYFPDNSSGTPQFTTLQVKAETERVVLELSHQPASGERRCYRWEVQTTPGQTVALTFPWDDFADLAFIERKVLVTPVQNSRHSTISCIQGSEPTLVHRLTSGTGIVTLGSIDRDVTREGAPVEDPTDVDTDVDGQPVGFALGDLQEDPCQTGENSIVLLTRGPALHQGAVPTDASALVAMDSRSQPIPGAKAPPQTSTPQPLTEEKAETIRQAIQSAFQKGSDSELFRKFVLQLSDLLVLEQGSGAGLWKKSGANDGAYLEKMQGVYRPGKSDHDYEIFLPSFKAPPDGYDYLGAVLGGEPPQPDLSDPALSPEQRTQLEDDFDEAFRNYSQSVRAFEIFAHTREFMQGDWYFNPPHGLNGSRNLGPVPYFEDREELKRYLGGVTHWRYYLPVGATSSLNGQSLPAEPIPSKDATPRHYFDIPKGAKFFGEEDSIFDFPVTPAEAISFALTQRLKAESDLREVLPDVSFFPFRKEHFFYGIPSLEKPPPFGDDPIGDAGMGRGLLHLKWVLEGAFLPSFPALTGGNFNPGVDAARDLELRTIAFERLKQRRNELALDAYEWGIYQEFAMLLESVPLRLVRPAGTAGAACLQELSDFLKKHDAKSIKKVGKSGIRGVLAKLSADQSVRNALFAVPPATFDANKDLKSFEHFIVSLAQSNPGALGTLPIERVRQFLAAKVGDDQLIQGIIRSREGYEEFVLSAFTFLRESVQAGTFGVYSAGLEEIQKQARVDEWHRRVSNVLEIDYGFLNSKEEPISGRAAMHGREPGHNFSYTLSASLRRVGDMPDGPYTLSLSGGQEGSITYGPLSFQDENSLLYVDGKPLTRGGPSLSVLRTPLSSAEPLHVLSVSPPGGSDDVSRNDVVETQSYVISTTGLFQDEIKELKDRIVVYRGLQLDNETLRLFRENELEQGLLRAASIRNGETFEAGIERNVRIATHLFNTRGTVSGFTLEDFNQLTPVQKAVIAHIQVAPQSEFDESVTMGAVGDFINLRVRVPQPRDPTDPNAGGGNTNQPSDATGWMTLDEKLVLFDPEDDEIFGTFRLFFIDTDTSGIVLQVVDAPTNKPPGTILPEGLRLRSAVGELGISTARRMQEALLFATGGSKDAYIVAVEVPIQHGGFQYLPINVPSSEGGFVPRLVNPREGDEVVFLGEMHFIRAHLFRLQDDPISIIPNFNSPILEWVQTYEGSLVP